MFLQANGVSNDSIQELQDMIDRDQFMDALHRAQEYVEYGLLAKFGGDGTCTSKEPFDLEAMLNLFTGAWEALSQHAHGQSRRAGLRLSKLELEMWAERIQQQDLSPLQRFKRRQQRQLMDYKIQKELKGLGDEYAQLVQFKRSSTTRVLHIREWARCIRSKHRRNKLGGRTSDKASSRYNR